MPNGERSLYAARAAHLSWANTDDRKARTARARTAARDRFLVSAGGDPIKAEHLRKAFYLELAAKGVAARRRQSRSPGAL